MWSVKYLKRMDYRLLPVLFCLMGISLLVLTSYGLSQSEGGVSFLHPIVKSQIKWFIMGWGVFIFCAGFDYHKIRELTWILYAFMLFSLIGLFFAKSVQSVNRWYKIPLLGIGVQPSEIAKLVVVFSLSWLLERRRHQSEHLSTALLGGIVAGIPFLLILKQPDLGTALVLFPITLVIFYFGGLNRWVIRCLALAGLIGMLIVSLFLTETLSHEEMKPFMLKFMKSYQYERLNPDSYHQRASSMAMSLGGVSGKGWQEGDYTGRGYLPAAYTDSVFPAFGEEFGLIGMLFLMGLYYLLLYLCFQVTMVAKDHFGRLLAAGIAVYFAMHILVNIGMMCGFLPITGVPLVLVTYGGSCTLSTMAALGILQSIYSRRFMF